MNRNRAIIVVLALKSNYDAILDARIYIAEIRNSRETQNSLIKIEIIPHAEYYILRNRGELLYNIDNIWF